MLVHLAVTLLPTVKGAFWYANPAEDTPGCDLGPVVPMVNIIDDAIAYVVGPVH